MFLLLQRIYDTSDQAGTRS